MPKRTKHRRQSFRYHSTKRLRGAAISIQSAWRRRKRRKVGLNARTTLANRRAIRTLKKAPEVKDLMVIQANSPNGYHGQYMRPVQVDNLGLDLNGVSVVLKPFRGMVQGAGGNDRIGNFVKHRRTTFKFYIEAPSALIAPIVEEYNEVTVIICLDTAPNTTTAPQLTGLTSGTLLDGVSTNPTMKYYLEKNVGKTRRYKPLYKKTVRLAPVQGGVVGYLQSTPYPPFARWSHTIKAPYKLEYGTALGTTNLYPQNQELICFFMSDSSALPHPMVSCYCKMTWTDV